MHECISLYVNVANPHITLIFCGSIFENISARKKKEKTADVGPTRQKLHMWRRYQIMYIIFCVCFSLYIICLVTGVAIVIKSVAIFYVNDN